MLAETDFIRRLKRNRSLAAIGDDCAVLPKDEFCDMLITADMLVENIDFKLEWMMPGALGHKALAVSLSDIAAMGGTPRWAMVSIAMPKEMWRSEFAESFFDGWFALAETCGVELVGGDISAGSEVAVDSIVGGEVGKGTAVLRSTASPGDLIYVTGTLGGAAAGLRLLERSTSTTSSEVNSRELIRRQLMPTPQTEIGILLNEMRAATAMIDVSDGLSTDLGHICNASGVGATIDASSIPIDPKIRLIPGFSAEAGLDLALNGGEDLELLFTTARPIDLADVHLIGTIDAETGLRLRDSSGAIKDLPRKGFQHF